MDIIKVSKYINIIKTRKIRHQTYKNNLITILLRNQLKNNLKIIKNTKKLKNRKKINNLTSNENV